MVGAQPFLHALRSLGGACSPLPPPPCPVSVSLHSRSFIPAQRFGLGLWAPPGVRGGSFCLTGGQEQHPWCSWAGQTHHPGDSCLASELPKHSPGSVLGSWEVPVAVGGQGLQFRHSVVWDTCAGGRLPPVQVNNQLSVGKRRDPPPKVWMPILIDCTFDKESELTPLESAMLVLDFIHEEFSVADRTMEAVQKMVKEAVRVFFFSLNTLCSFCLGRASCGWWWELPHVWDSLVICRGVGVQCWH